MDCLSNSGDHITIELMTSTSLPPRLGICNPTHNHQSNATDAIVPVKPILDPVNMRSENLARHSLSFSMAPSEDHVGLPCHISDFTRYTSRCTATQFSRCASSHKNAVQ